MHGSERLKHIIDVKSLPSDTALLMLISDLKKPVNVFGISSNCHKVNINRYAVYQSANYSIR